VTTEANIEAGCNLNYGAPCGGDICHVPEPGDPDDVWWFGFDCAHAFDISPGRDAFLRSEGVELPARIGRLLGMQTYRALPYVRRTVEQLAEQLAAMGAGGD
jgi:hypothetical protein